MKKTAARSILAIALLIAASSNTQGQGTFQNLDFEGARIVPDPDSPDYPYAVAVSNALPGWTVYGGTVLPYDIIFNDLSLGSALVTIHDHNDPFGYLPLQGRYSVDIAGSDAGTPASAAIGQTGQIPFGTQSLLFWGQLGAIQITVGGQVIPYVTIGSGPNYGIYGADISAFAGLTEELRFTALFRTHGFIDNIQFSTQAIPEPGIAGLFALGGFVLAQQRWRRFIGAGSE